MDNNSFRILSLDGGGAKGFYTLGVLREIEALSGRRLSDSFDLIYGTSTGSIIASLLAMGKEISEIRALYEEHVLDVVTKRKKAEKSGALEKLGDSVFGDLDFTTLATDLGIVTTKWDVEEPMIFKSSLQQAHGRRPTFQPGFGVKLKDAVVASCSAFPFFDKKLVTTINGDKIELIDGGYCANNPALYALTDATVAFGISEPNIRLVSIGCGNYPSPKNSYLSAMRYAKYLQSVVLLQKTLEINTKSMEKLRSILFATVPTVRISETYSEPEMATDLFENNMRKLNLIAQRGADSFAKYEQNLTAMLSN